MEGLRIRFKYRMGLMAKVYHLRQPLKNNYSYIVHSKYGIAGNF